MSHKPGAWATVAVVAGLVFGLGMDGALAQNAAQRAALARLGHAQTRAQASGGSVDATEAANISLSKPGGVAFDAAGDLFIADTNNNRVLEVDVNGVVSTVAGNGVQGFGGDGAAATDALLDSPAGVTVDSNGNIYIADTHNNRIREVAGGTITTIAGTGDAGFSGDGAAASAAALSYPTAVAVDRNCNVYIADTDNHRIRKISGTTISTVAGNGNQSYSGDGALATAAGLDSPNGVAVDAALNLYIGDTHNQRVRMVAYSTGIITTLAGTGVKGFTADGTATNAALALPRGVAVNESGTVYVADSDNNRIRAISGGQITTIAGNGDEGYSGDTQASSAAELDAPSGVAVQGTQTFFSDTGNQRVRVVSGNTINTIAGAGSVESLALSGPTSVVYGTGSLTATFSNGSNSATGQVTFYDGLGSSPSEVGTALLTANSASLNTSRLSAGTHSLVASYAGDANNAAIASGVYVLLITPVQLTAAANPVTLVYGQTIPVLTGTLAGVLPQDAGNVTANFSTTATATSAPGTYPVTVALSGSAAGNYSVVLSAGAASISIGLAPTQIALTGSSNTPILGASFTLTATVSSTTSGTPTGTVNFYDGATLLNGTPVTLSGGAAIVALTALPVGAHSITAVYSGDTDFVASTSTAVTPTVLTPDFSIASPTPAQSVLPGKSVDYTITLTPVNPTFIYPITLSASGLPSGVTATFNPSSIPAGGGTSNAVLTLTASAQTRYEDRIHSVGRLAAPAALALLMLPLAFRRRARRTSRLLSHFGKVWLALLAFAGLSVLSGCGGSGFFAHSTKSYTVTVTAANGINTHSTNVTLTLQ